MMGQAGLTLGELRNRALEAALGERIIRRDDDGWQEGNISQTSSCTDPRRRLDIRPLSRSAEFSLKHPRLRFTGGCVSCGGQTSCGEENNRGREENRLHSRSILLKSALPAPGGQ